MRVSSIRKSHELRTKTRQLNPLQEIKYYPIRWSPIGLYLLHITGNHEPVESRDHRHPPGRDAVVVAFTGEVRSLLHQPMLNYSIELRLIKNQQNILGNAELENLK